MVILAAALVPGAAVSRARASCEPDWDQETLRVVIEDSPLIVVATVESADRSGVRPELRLVPEAFLKGPVSTAPITLTMIENIDAPCRYAGFMPGERVLVIVRDFSGPPRWPGVHEAWSLSNGNALNKNPATSGPVPEEQLVESIRDITEQYAVPPQSSSESQGIDWWKTVVPVAGAVLGIFVAGLFLMRIWHRIDPS